MSSTTQLCQNSSKRDVSENSCIISLQQELSELKETLEMQEIINQEQEEKLKKLHEEKKNLTNEKTFFINTITKMEKEIEETFTTVQVLKQKLVEVDESLVLEKEKAEEEHEKVKKLLRENKNLTQTLDNDSKRIIELENQLKEEREFYDKEKLRYYNELKEQRKQIVKVEVDDTKLDEESISSKKEITRTSTDIACVKSHTACKELLRLKSLYKRQLMTTWLICEKYLKLIEQRKVLLKCLSRTRKDYKEAVCKIKFELDACKSEYTSLLEDRCNDDEENNLLKIVNRSNQLVSDNAILKQELIYLKNCLYINKSCDNLCDDDDSLMWIINKDSYFNKDENGNGKQEVFYGSNRVSNKKQKQMKKQGNSKNRNALKTYNSSAPVSSESDTTDDYTNIKYKYYRKKRNNIIYNRAEFSDYSDSDTSDSDSLKSFNVKHFYRINVCPSFISFESDEAKNEHSENSVKKEPEKIDNNKHCGKIINKINNENKFHSYDKKNLNDTAKKEQNEPAYIQVTCVEIKTELKKGNQTSKTTPQDDNNNDLKIKEKQQEWLTKAPIIECNHWSKSILGFDVFKSESAPGLLMKNSNPNLYNNKMIPDN